MGVTRSSLPRSVPGAGAPVPWWRNRRVIPWLVQGAVGNYGEIFDRNVGPGSRLKLDRGVNKQWKEGGLIYSPPFR